ncbi:MAG: M48 family metalloprotease [Proteobacteria bacterium]|nr:M48 family metalloprotease [Pseudomonadota bacterium]
MRAISSRKRPSVRAATALGLPLTVAPRVTTISWATQLRYAVNDVAATGLASAHTTGAAKHQFSLQWVLMRAPAIAELLMLALSRLREIEADAFALELTGDAKTLETALSKLEHHHRAMSGIPEDCIEDRLDSYLCSPGHQRMHRPPACRPALRGGLARPIGAAVGSKPVQPASATRR